MTFDLSWTLVEIGKMLNMLKEKKNICWKPFKAMIWMIHWFMKWIEVRNCFVLQKMAILQGLRIKKYGYENSTHCLKLILLSRNSSFSNSDMMQLSKHFEPNYLLHRRQISVDINRGCVFGMLTLLRSEDLYSLFMSP